MEWTSFFIEMTDILAWPMVVLVIIFSFKKEFTDLANAISELRIGRFRVIFEKSILANVIANKKPEEATDSEEPMMTREEIFNIPDDDYEFMQKIANNVSFLPISESEVFKYNSLVNQGYFEEDKDEKWRFKPTKKGNEIIAALKSIYYS